MNLSHMPFDLEEVQGNDEYRSVVDLKIYCTAAADEESDALNTAE